MKYSLLFLISIMALQSAWSQCYPDRHNSTWFDGWVSCEESVNPNPARGNGHWILYNFHQQYALFEMDVWNFNAPDYLDYGMQEVVIDISADSITWTEYGQVTFPQANGLNTYEGAEVLDFDSTLAQYVLVTAVSNYGGSCYGLSEIRIRAQDLCDEDRILWIAGDGDWNVPSNWCNNRIPTEVDEVVIPSDVVVTIPFLYTAHVWTISLDPDAELRMIGSLVAHKQE